MKAIVQDRYGGPDVLELRDVADPVAGAGEVLLRVQAASVNAYDWHVMRGDPYFARLASRSIFGWRAPRRPIRGRDVAGVVEAVGPGVTDLRPGDEVYGEVGDTDGAFAELVTVPAAHLARRPESLSPEEAAAVPLAATTALTGLRDVGRVGSGQRVLINGASGGVGTFAVQIAAALGAEVTGVCRTRNLDLVRSVGAHHVVDYTTTDFARAGEQYDVVLDLVGNRSLADLRRALTVDGTLLLSGGGTSEGGSVVGPMWLFLHAELRGRFARPQRLVSFGPTPNAADLITLQTMVRPAIDRTYPLGDVPEAVRYVEREHARAKVVITVS